MIVHNVGATGIYSSFVTNSLVQNNVSYSNGEHGFYMANSPQNVQVLNNVAYDNATAGLEVNADASQGGPGTAQNITIANNIFYDNDVTNHSGAMNLDGVQNSLIYNNLLYGNNATGLVLYDGDASQGCIDNTIVNNTIVMPSNGNNDQYALDNNTNSYGNKFYNNIMLGEMFVDSGRTPGAWSNNILWTGYTNDGAYAFPAGIEWTPAALFQAPSTGNYQELSTSPSIGAGTSTDPPSTDILGNPRPSSNGYDIGMLRIRDDNTYTHAHSYSYAHTNTYAHTHSYATPTPTPTTTATSTSTPTATPTPAPRPRPHQHLHNRRRPQRISYLWHDGRIKPDRHHAHTCTYAHTNACVGAYGPAASPAAAPAPAPRPHPHLRLPQSPSSPTDQSPTARRTNQTRPSLSPAAGGPVILRLSRLLWGAKL